MQLRKLFLLFCWLLAWVGGMPTVAAQPSNAPLGALTAQEASQQVKASLLAYAPQGVAAGKPVWLGIQLEHQPHWHTYWVNPGDTGLPTELTWQLPPQFKVGAIQWPTPSLFLVGDLANNGYDQVALLPVPVTVDAQTPSQGSVKVAVQANWLACRQECIPQQAQLSLDVPLGQPLLEHAAAFEQALAQQPKNNANVQISAQVDAAASALHVTATKLPAAWQGKPLNVFTPTPDVVQLVTIKQQWNGSTWHMTAPLHALRSTTPDKLALVLALQGEATNEVRRNQAGVPSYLVQVPISGTWPAAAQVAGLPQAFQAAVQASAAASGTTVAAVPAVQPAGDMTWWVALLSAFAGGLLLNLMPCVFPVLAIKVMGFARHAHQPRALRISGIAYAVGVVLSLCALAGLLLAMRAAGEQLGWGFQLQNPWLVAGLATLFTVMALNLAGLFEWRGVSSRWTQAESERPTVNAFLSGVLAVVVASPCTAPFMGAALGFAIGLPAWQALCLFAVMGLGLALPVVLGSFFPAFLQWLPKPGAWMHTLRQLLAFPLLGSAVWLLWVLGQQAGIDGVAVLLALLLCLAGMLWAWGQLTGTWRWVLAPVFALAGAVVAWQYGGVIGARLPDTKATSSANSVWQSWSQDKVAQALAQGKPVFVDYTAAWCITCQWNKKAVLQTEAFLTLMQQRQVVLLQADWTRQDGAITQSLNQLGRTGVPTYAVYLPAQPNQPKVLTEVLTLANVQQAFAP